MKTFLLGIVASMAALLMASTGSAQLKTIKVKTPADLHGFFHYSGKEKKIISGHRGSYLTGYPENAIETFEYVLKHTPAFFEIDPRLTKDSVIVLLHDATLDRTTTGKGKLADYTWEEVKQLRLKDKDGNVTPYRIPTLQEAIDWARGKTILNLDKKDVPMQMTADIIRKNNAGSFVMVTVHNAKQAKFYFDDDNQRMMSAFVKTEDALKEYEAVGLPWKNMIAYIGSENKPANKTMFDLLHARGVMCMISAAPVYDKLETKEERAAAFRDIFKQGADILESDLPVEVAEAVKSKR
ncbi:glycerophosphodiester phosphodiesterase family protein [Pseudobacter ginsenosidimutans]|uniref:Glycerophosphoryl diester phosphodiesterase n=1 Tax=Pseudobacter ginsenosidimutans TaxID=661488 RepID=A0A4Q7MT65_9BACT|nr:glycerophosphodiester phosphodiesterase family protein [Pseudobacter ginsenosidimutans]QEC41529.1 glycerophosphodiester phosphodiesterase family protein [Pseudobacter ginsenosidimutans]RZS71688.1 glycerophosphoryl diester phosphodiesterase [Pseudobacter ginsenosidimutans]